MLPLYHRIYHEAQDAILVKTLDDYYLITSSANKNNGNTRVGGVVFPVSNSVHKVRINTEKISDKIIGMTINETLN